MALPAMDLDLSPGFLAEHLPNSAEFWLGKVQIRDLSEFKWCARRVASGAATRWHRASWLLGPPRNASNDAGKSWLRSVGSEDFTPAEEFGIDLREFFELVVKLVESRGGLARRGEGGVGFEEELADLARAQALGEIIVGSMLLSPAAAARR